VEGIEGTPTTTLRRSGFGRMRRRRAGLAAAVAGLAIFTLLAIGTYRDGDDIPVARHDASIVLAALPAEPVIPDLAAGGLTLVGTEVERVSGASVLVAAYRGPRGCRLELRVHPAAVKMPPTAGTIRHSWTTGELSYELAAFGMPASRFALIAAAAEQQSRISEKPQKDRLREARAGSAPCAA
jgi:hypothetical protein